MRCLAITPSLLWMLAFAPTQVSEQLKSSKVKKQRIGSVANPISFLWRVVDVSVVVSKKAVNGRSGVFTKLPFMSKIALSL